MATRRLEPDAPSASPPNQIRRMKSMKGFLVIGVVAVVAVYVFNKFIGPKFGLST